jgi:hypothetical protein
MQRLYRFVTSAAYSCSATVELGDRPAAITVAQFFKGEHEASTGERPEPSTGEDRRERHAGVLTGDTSCKQITYRRAYGVLLGAR